MGIVVLGAWLQKDFQRFVACILPSPAGSAPGRENRWSNGKIGDKQKNFPTWSGEAVDCLKGIGKG